MPIRLIDTDEMVTVPFPTPIALVRSDERYDLTVYGTQVQYRRLPVRELVRLQQQAQRANGAGRERDLQLKYGVLAWQGLEDPHGQAVEVSIPLQDELLRALPGVVKGAFAGPFGAIWPEGLPREEPGATLTVRRILDHELQQIRAEHTIRGELHVHALALAVVQHCLKDWTNVRDAGQPVPLSPEASARLPVEAVMQAWHVTQATTIQQEAELGNSAPPLPAT